MNFKFYSVVTLFVFFLIQPLSADDRYLDLSSTVQYSGYFHEVEVYIAPERKKLDQIECVTYLFSRGKLKRSCENDKLKPFAVKINSDEYTFPAIKDRDQPHGDDNFFTFDQIIIEYKDSSTKTHHNKVLKYGNRVARDIPGEFITKLVDGPAIYPWERGSDIKAISYRGQLYLPLEIIALASEIDRITVSEGHYEEYFNRSYYGFTEVYKASEVDLSKLKTEPLISLWGDIKIAKKRRNTRFFKPWSIIFPELEYFKVKIDDEFSFKVTKYLVVIIFKDGSMYRTEEYLKIPDFSEYLDRI